MTVLVNNIMKKVQMIFLMRRLVTPFAFFAVAFIVFVSTVSISHVIENMPTIVNIQAVIHFFVSAFAHTDIIVKSALVAGIIFLGITLRGLFKSLHFLNSFQKI